MPASWYSFCMQYAVQASAGVSDPAAVDKLCAEGRDAAKFLTQYVVQAELNERGNYGVHPPLTAQVSC